MKLRARKDVVISVSESSPHRTGNGAAGLLGIRSPWRRANFRHTGCGSNLLNGGGVQAFTAAEGKNAAIDCLKGSSPAIAQFSGINSET